MELRHPGSPGAVNDSFPRSRTALPPVLARTSFTSREAEQTGMTWSRLRSAGASSPSRGLWVPEGVDSPHYQARALSLLRPDGVISHLTAARIWGFPLPRIVDEKVHLTLRPEAARTRRRGVTVHRLPFDSVKDVVRLPAGTLVTSRLRTAADLSTVLEEDDVVAVLDHLLRHPRPRLEHRPAGYERRPFAQPGDLDDLIRSLSGRHGVKPLRRCVAHARVGSDSPRETKLRLACVRAGLPEPELNVPIEIPDEHGRIVARLHEPDLQWRDFRVCAEYEGLHHSDLRQVERDVRRGDAARDNGWTEVRIVSSDMARSGARAVAKIEKALRMNGWRPD
jgi:hypothetical protein